MKSYKDLLREINYLEGCLSFDNYVYAACIGVFKDEVKALGCIKFLSGIDHWRSTWMVGKGPQMLAIH